MLRLGSKGGRHGGPSKTLCFAEATAGRVCTVSGDSSQYFVIAFLGKGGSSTRHVTSPAAKYDKYVN